MRNMVGELGEKKGTYWLSQPDTVEGTYGNNSLIWGTRGNNRPMEVWLGHMVEMA